MRVDTPPIPHDCSVKDIPERKLRQLRATISYHVRKRLGTSVESVYVMGSFARHEAMAVASDLDLRIVVSDCPQNDSVESFEKWLKNEFGKGIKPELCGFVDGRIATEHPDNTEPSYNI